MFGITMGDSSGVGPEIILKAAAAGALRHPYVVFGDAAVLERANHALGYGLRIVVSDEASPPGAVHVVDHGIVAADDVRPGELSELSGLAARAYVVSATTAALAGEIDAMVTLPMNKEATQLSDPTFTGHTELIGEICGAADVTIMLVSDDLIVTHVSTHCSLREAIERATTDRVERIIELTWDAVARLRPTPRIAVAGLNPHAGENGLFGREEIEEIEPAIRPPALGAWRWTGPSPRTPSSTSPCAGTDGMQSCACTTTRGTSRRSCSTSSRA